MNGETASRRVPSRERRIVYGPVLSRRLGFSLGINLNLRRSKTCTFDCVYCQYGKTTNQVSSPCELDGWDETLIFEELDARLRRLKAEDQVLDSITFAGYGEPTLYPNLKKAVKGVNTLRDNYFPRALVDMLTNASTIPHKRVFEALKELDSVVAKLDAGRQETYVAINRPCIGVPNLGDVIESLARLQEVTGRVTLQTLIFRSADPGKKDNSRPNEIKLIAEKADLIKPVEVQVYTVSRYPLEPFVEPVDVFSLRESTEIMNQILKEKCAKMYI